MQAKPERVINNSDLLLSSALVSQLCTHPVVHLWDHDQRGWLRVQVYEVDESSRQVVQVSALVDTGSERPIRLHAGPLLGIAFTSTITNGALVATPGSLSMHCLPIAEM